MKNRILQFVLIYVNYLLPILIFWKFFRAQITDFTGIYDVAIFNASVIGFMLALLNVFVLKRSKKQLVKIFFSVIYLIFYCFSCIEIGFDYRINFGTTWLYSEIFPALIHPHWYFYFLGISGFIIHYFIQKQVSKSLKTNE